MLPLSTIFVLDFVRIMCFFLLQSITLVKTYHNLKVFRYDKCQ
jgi:hypothetical protein